MTLTLTIAIVPPHWSATRTWSAFLPQEFLNAFLEGFLVSRFRIRKPETGKERILKAVPRFKSRISPNRGKTLPCTRKKSLQIPSHESGKRYNFLRRTVPVYVRGFRDSPGGSRAIGDGYVLNRIFISFLPCGAEGSAR
jgi:hypothetical protein